MPPCGSPSRGSPASDGRTPATARHPSASGSPITEDPALVPTLLRGARNALGSPSPGRALVIDIDQADWFGQLEAAGLPPTFTVDSPTAGHGHVYGWVPESMDMAAIPGTFGGGELRRHSPRTDTASMVLGPWAKRQDGVYTPREGNRVLATFPESVIDLLIESGRFQSQERREAQGPADPGWKVSSARHDFLVGRARNLRGVGMSGDRLLDELRRIDRERCDPPLADDPREGDHELVRIAEWANQHIADDPPGYFLVDTPKVSAGPDGQTGRKQPPTAIDAADLLALDLPPLRMVVPGLVPEGTSVIASPPKVGKSCLVYQMAVEVALGGSLLGRRVTPGLGALPRPRGRPATRAGPTQGGARRPHDAPGAARGPVGVPAHRAGLEEDMTAWLDAHPDAALVAIDTFQKVRQRSTGKRGQYEVDVDDLGRLQALFRDRPVALVIVHHSQQGGGRRLPRVGVRGTYGITGSVDTIVVIRRKRLEVFGTIVATGREIAEAELSVQFDGMLWTTAPASLPEASSERTEVYRIIEELGPIFPAGIADKLGLGRTSVQNMVAKLVSSGAVIRTTRGYQTAGVMSHHLPMTLADDSVAESSESSISGDVSVGTALPERGDSGPLYTPDDSSDYVLESHQRHRGRKDTPGRCQGCGLDSPPGLDLPASGEGGMSAATLTERPGPVPGTIEVILDCPHATTTGVLVNADDSVRVLSVALIAERHERDERCGCALSLRMPGARA